MIGDTDKILDVILLDGQPSDGGPGRGAVKLAAELATRIGGKNIKPQPAEGSTTFNDLKPGQLAIAPTSSWQALAAPDPPAGAALVMVLDSPQPPGDDDHSPFSIRDAQI